MAEATALRNNALPYPVYGAPWTVVFPMLDADGDLVTGASTPDAEVSKNGDTFADCTNESTEIATSSGMYYLTLTATEMTADIVAVIAKSATAGMKTTALTFYPRKLVTIRSGTSADDGSGTSSIVLDAGANAVDDFYNGMLCVAVLDSVTEARIITDYNGSTKAATVTPDWNTAPDNNDTFTIYLPEGVQLNQANVSHAASVAWGSGAITAGVIATDAIGAAKVASDVGTEIATAVWASGTRTITALDEDSVTLDLDATIRAAVGLASANLDTQLGDLPTAGENADAVWEEAIAGHSGTAGSTAEQLAAAGAAGDPWATALPGSYTSGQAGKIVGDNLNATVSSRATQTSVDDIPTNSELATALDALPTASENATAIWGAGTRSLTVLDEDSTTLDIDSTIRGAVGMASANLDTQLGDLPTNAELATALGTADDAVLAAIAALNNPSAATIADAVWDEDATAHQTGGTFGQAIGDPAANTATIYDAVITDAAGTNIAADIIAIEAQTDDIGVAGAGLTAVPWNAAWDAEVQSEVADALAVYDPPTNAELVSAIDAVQSDIAALNNLSAAAVNAEVVDALNVDTYAEPGQGAPAATASIVSKLGYLYKAWRNRTTQTASEYALYADDGSTKDQEAVVSDNGTTFERGEISTGA